MKEAYIDWRPRGVSITRIAQCDEIIEQYMSQGYTLTLRQLYYQLVSRDLIPNSERSYKNLGAIVSKGRLAGMLDWEAIEDRGRVPHKRSEWNSIASIVRSAIASYRLPRWQGQTVYAELWVEKDALAGVLRPLADRYHATLMVNKGYSSQSAMYESADRIRDALSTYEAEEAVVFYLGDHDPSGIDMVRDIRERLALFLGNDFPITVKRIALTMEQIEEHNPPPNPTKVTDSRADAYISQFGHECWEVDALDPPVLGEIISESFDGVIDRELMDEVIEREEREKVALREAADNI